MATRKKQTKNSNRILKLHRDIVTKLIEYSLVCFSILESQLHDGRRHLQDERNHQLLLLPHFFY